MKVNLTKNWIAKILSLLIATAIWFLIKDHLGLGADGSNSTGSRDDWAYDAEGKLIGFQVDGETHPLPLYDSNGQPIPRARIVREN